MSKARAIHSSRSLVKTGSSVAENCHWCKNIQAITTIITGEDQVAGNWSFLSCNAAKRMLAY
jgi:hypothetical protein